MSMLGSSDNSPRVLSLLECRVLAANSKGKIVVKAKLIAWRSPDESQFLNDLVMFLSRSGATGGDELLSIRTPAGLKISLTGRVVRDQIKDTCRRLGLPPNYFSSHSLYKGSVTQMRANRASEDDRRDRGNYAPGTVDSLCCHPMCEV